ncbi:hypothetical protein [Clostridium massiliamazoniense]|uniref:hypothetical protein n=1 Tax=Clostridium massiliamazoniense TaxID=1347366 RepID=UPI0006D7A710|nr:hypothetical protein [Clostridium massiliamazoniense]
MDLKNYVIEKFEKYYYENDRAINIQEACYLYMDKQNLLEILKEKEFFKVADKDYGLVKWILQDICKIFNATGFFEVINIKEVAQKTYGIEIEDVSELLKKLRILGEQWKFEKSSFKDLLREYNIVYDLELISEEKEEKSIIDELEEELICEKKTIKRLEEKLREQELFKINIEIEEIMKYYKNINKISLSTKIGRFLGSSDKGMSFDELYYNISILEDITKDELYRELESSRLLEENNEGIWILRNNNISEKEIDMKKLIEIVENYVNSSSSKTLKESWNIFKEYNFTKEEVSLQKIGNKYGYTRDYTFQLHNMSIEMFEYKKIKRYLDLYLVEIEQIIKEEKFIKIKSESYKKIFGQWNTKKFINFINKLGLDLILTDNKYIMSKNLYEEYFFSKKEILNL